MSGPRDSDPGGPGGPGSRAEGAGGPESKESLELRLARLTEDHHRLFAELAAAEGRYRRLSRAVWQVEEGERRRLSRELHDGLGQTLTALKHLLARLADRARGNGAAEELGDDLERALEIATAALADAREMSRLLRPPMLDDLGLVPALSWLARSLGEGAGLEVELTVEPPEAGERRLGDELETLVFRCVQESLTNVLKHADAGRARVDLRVGDREVRVRVADPGSGFDPDATLADADAGVGLQGLRDRVALFGGHCRIASAPGRGTEIEIRVPRDED